ncbi:hypothetical protein Pfo_015384 [Paulownia fortunei]|nr:hypothetical protein Pfo_015384 [Paulownia fortunei]
MATCHQCSKSTNISILLLVYLIFFESSCQEILALRPLEGEQWLKKNLVIQSLPRGRVPASRSSPCTYIPGGKSRGRCALAAIKGDFSGHPATAPAAAFPPVMVRFTTASKSNGSHNQESS